MMTDRVVGYCSNDFGVGWRFFKPLPHCTAVVRQDPRQRRDSFCSLSTTLPPTPSSMTFGIDRQRNASTFDSMHF